MVIRRGPSLDALRQLVKETGATALAVDAGRTLMIDKAELLRKADEAGIAIVASAVEE